MGNIMHNGVPRLTQSAVRVGEDALGSLYAPDLRKSLNQGMKEQKFITIAMEGVKAKGMAGWAGFLTPHEVRAFYDYVKGRAIGVVPAGAPKE